MLFLRAIVQRLSPDFTVYEVAGVTSAMGSATSAPATGVPGLVGVKRTPVSFAGAGAAAAGVSGLNVIADDAGAVSVEAAGVAAVTGEEAAGGGLVLALVSLGEGAVLLVELQPGLAKMRISAKRWMPTTMPKIFRIFIGGLVERFVKVGAGECYPKLAAGVPF